MLEATPLTEGWTVRYEGGEGANCLPPSPGACTPTCWRPE